VDKSLSAAATLDTAAARRPLKQRIRPLNSADRRRLHMFALPKDSQYSRYQPLHALWLQYMEELLGDDLKRYDLLFAVALPISLTSCMCWQWEKCIRIQTLES
jgi:hypothetical protein